MAYRPSISWPLAVPLGITALSEQLVLAVACTMLCVVIFGNLIHRILPLKEALRGSKPPCKEALATKDVGARLNFLPESLVSVCLGALLGFVPRRSRILVVL